MLTGENITLSITMVFRVDFIAWSDFRTQ